MATTISEAPFDVTTLEIIRRFDAIAALRDEALTTCRQIVRFSANSVRATHRGETASAATLAQNAKVLLDPLLDRVGGVPELLYAGYVQDAMREYAEARLTATFVSGDTVPGPIDLRVSDSAYLNALAESASELRRSVLDLLRAGDIASAEHRLQTMDAVYAALMLVDYPDAMTGGLRRSVDALRAVLERTRGDVTVAVGQHRLSSELRRVQRRLEEASSHPSD